MTRLGSSPLALVLALALACGPTPRSARVLVPVVPTSASHVVPMTPGGDLALKTTSAERAVMTEEAPVTTTDPPEPPQLEAEMGRVYDDERALTVARVEGDFGCLRATDAAVNPPLRLLEVKEHVRLWASIGPAFPSFLRRGRAVLSVTTVGPSPSLLACGPAIALDLAPGRYWIRGQTRTTIYGEAGQPPLPSGFMYRVSKLGDTSCPAQLATRGVHDWDGDFPFEVTQDWLIDADTKRDFRVDYQMAFMNPGTRLLVNAPYPTCQRVVADVPAKLQPLPSRTHGYRDFRFAFWDLHPVPAFGGRMVTEYPARYSTITGSYEVGRLSRCIEGFASDSPARDRFSERLCAEWLRQTEPTRPPYELVASWLDSAPAVRSQLLPATATASSKGLALLRALDDEGFRAEIGATVCAPRPGKTELVLQLRLHGLRDVAGSWSREAWLLFTRAPGHADVLSGVFDSSPCPLAADPDGVEDFMEAWLEQPWRAGSGGATSADHDRVQRARHAERVASVDTGACARANDPAAPSSWLYSVFIAPSDGGAPAPTYFVVSGRSGAFSVVRSGRIQPAHCP
jgi:hypothetical protein